MLKPITNLTQTTAELSRVWIETTNEYFICISPEDLDWAKQFRWYVGKRNKQGGREGDPYISRIIPRAERPSPPIYLHVEIMRRVSAPPSPEHTVVDHINGKWWDCRRENLRWATRKENAQNRRNGHQIAPGVRYNPSGGTKPYQVRIATSYATAFEAQVAAQDVYNLLYGDFSPYYDHERD